MLIVIVASSVTVGAMSLWTDEETIAANTFTIDGTVDITLEGENHFPFNVSGINTQ